MKIFSGVRPVFVFAFLGAIVVSAIAYASGQTLVGTGTQYTKTASNPLTSGAAGQWIDTSGNLHTETGSSSQTVPSIAATTKGDIAAYTGTAWSRLPAGANGQCLQGNTSASTGLSYGACGGTFASTYSNTTANNRVTTNSTGGPVLFKPSSASQGNVLECETSTGTVLFNVSDDGQAILLSNVPNNPSTPGTVIGNNTKNTNNFSSPYLTVQNGSDNPWIFYKQSSVGDDIIECQNTGSFGECDMYAASEMFIASSTSGSASALDLSNGTGILESSNGHKVVVDNSTGVEIHGGAPGVTVTSTGSSTSILHIDQGNQTNIPGLVIDNAGAGTTGMSYVAANVSWEMGNSGNVLDFTTANQNTVYTCNNEAYADTSKAAFQWQVDTITASRSVASFTAEAGQTGDDVQCITNGIGENHYAGLGLINTTPAASLAQQDSGMLKWEGQQWNGSASVPIYWGAQTLAVDSDAQPGALQFYDSADGSTWNPVVNISDAGSGYYGLAFGANSNGDHIVGGNNTMQFDLNGFEFFNMASNGEINWLDGTNPRIYTYMGVTPVLLNPFTDLDATLGDAVNHRWGAIYVNHIASNEPTQPICTPGANTGSGATCTVTGGDSGFVATLTTGTGVSGGVTSTFTVAPTVAFDSVPGCIVQIGNQSAQFNSGWSAAMDYAISTTSNLSFTTGGSGSSLSDTTAYPFVVHCIQ